MIVEPRIAQNGLHFYGAGGVAFVLSHEQIKILVALLRFGSEERACLRNLVFVGKAWPDRRTAQALTPSQRASYSRSLRRLEGQGLIKGTPAIVELTPPGRDFVHWLASEWDGWGVYTRHFATDWGTEITAPAPTTAELAQVKR